MRSLVCERPNRVHGCAWKKRFPEVVSGGNLRKMIEASGKVMKPGNCKQMSALFEEESNHVKDRARTQES
ncbi:MAG: hypothetical protein C4532_06255 [Candidatus Abyssobacteria bacterium SURF_17]|uniref:Uncharacterized protein n=1 Tax=Candidatus Abyssobacteria bacterium SURF_17 TaxID=2093361 RepID=A0A419F250_9BACT|nr:MAG: hypothetical protein C4532_06255 [Candidatus Abyssubacteria bacterium SURF_17]